MLAFAFAHFEKGREGLLERVLDGGPEIFGISHLFVGLQNAGSAGDEVEGDGAGEFEFLGEAVEFADVGAGKPCVEADVTGGFGVGGVQRDARGQAAAGDGAVDGVSGSGPQALRVHGARPREISPCLRLTELSSTVILMPSRAHSPRP